MAVLLPIGVEHAQLKMIDGANSTSSIYPKDCSRIISVLQKIGKRKFANYICTSPLYQKQYATLRIEVVFKGGKNLSPGK